MGKLSDEDNATLEKLLAARDAEDNDDDEEMEWWEEGTDGKRRGGRMSVGRAKKTGLFADLFGDKPPPAEGGEGEGKPGKKPGDLDKFFKRGSGQD